MSILAVVIAAIVAIYGVVNAKDLPGVAAICAVFVTPAFAGKVMQKSKEKNESD
jgi:hypothetical protein